MNKKIDYVLTYLDPTDQYWIESFKKRMKKDPPKNNHNLDNQTMLLKYNLRGIAKNMPFINKLHIIVFSKSQVPKWINLDEVDIITHDEFVDKKYLPTFNSSVYKIYYGNMPRVSEYFIQGSDDFYLLNEFKIEDFYTENYEPIIEKLTKIKSEYENIITTGWNETIKTCNHLAKEITNKSYDGSFRWYHFPHAYRKSYCKKILDIGIHKLEPTMTPIRDYYKNIENLFWVLCTYLEYGHMNNIDMKQILDERSCDSKHYVFPHIKQLKNSGIKCLNLNYINQNDIDLIIDQFEKIYPEKSKYEL